jgi:hypothetical protein
MLLLNEGLQAGRAPVVDGERFSTYDGVDVKELNYQPDQLATMIRGVYYPK